MKNLIYLFVASALLIMSCKKNTTDNVMPDEQTVVHNSYMYPLAIGNYWVYGEFVIDSSGNETQNNITDSVYIDKETIISGQTYFRMFYKDLYNSGQYFYYRDSSGYRVTLNGIIDPITGLIGDTLSTYTDSMNYYSKYVLVVQPPASVTVQSEIFTDIYSVRSDSYLNPPFNTSFNPLHDFRLSGNKVGLLSYQFHFSSAPWNTFERRLIRFHLN